MRVTVETLAILTSDREEDPLARGAARQGSIQEIQFELSDESKDPDVEIHIGGMMITVNWHNFMRASEALMTARKV